MVRRVLIEGKELTEHDLTCPECGARLLLKPSRFGLFYGCEQWRMTGCQGAHGAHPDGSPLGTPADGKTKQARIQAHTAFDQLYQSGRMKRADAYRWLRHAMGLTAEQAHIGKFTIEQCERLVTKIAACRPEEFHPPLPSEPAIDSTVLRAAVEPGIGLMKLAKKLGVRARVLRQELQRNGIVLTRGAPDAEPR